MRSSPGVQGGRAGASGIDSQTPLTVLYLNASLTGRDAGPAMHGRMIVEHLRALGARVQSLPPIWEGRESSGPRNYEVLARYLPAEPRKLARGIWRTLSGAIAALCYARHKPDVVLARHFDYELLPSLVSFLLRRPLVLEVNAPMFLERRLLGRHRPRLLEIVERYQWKRADAICTVSQILKDVLVAKGVSAESIRVVPNGVDPRWAATVPRRRERVESVRVVFVGGFYQWHGVLGLIEAFARASREAPHLHLSLVGHGPDKKKAERLVRDLGLTERVEFMGVLSAEELAVELGRAEIGVAPYRRFEPFYLSPLKVFDYMGAGLAVVASAQGQICEIIRHGRDGLLYPPDALDVLSRRLAELADDPERRRDLGVEARRRVLDHYTWQHSAARIIDVCRDAAAPV